MIQRISTPLAAFLLIAAAATAQADVFFSGTIDINGGVSRSNTGVGGASVNNASSISLVGSAGNSYNNVFGTGAGGAAVVGDRIMSVGVIPLQGANTNTVTPNSFGADNNLVAIFALRGTITATPPIATANFQVDSPNANSNGGAIFIYDRSAAQLGGAAFNSVDPSTWVNDITNLTGAGSGLVARLGISDLADAFFAGPPGPLTTEAPPIINPSAINTSTAVFLASANLITELKLSITDFGTLLSDPQVSPSAGDFTLSDYAAYVLLNQQVLADQTTPGAAVDQTDLNAIAAALLGAGNFFSSNANLGTTFTPSLTNNSGDLIVNNTGGAAIPGAQFAVTQTPEPSSIALWAILGGIGAGYAAWRRKR